MMTGIEFDIEKFDGKNDFGLWQVRMKALLEQQGLAAGGIRSALLLLTSLPSSYDNFMETLLYGRDTMKLEDVVATLNSRVLQKMTEANGDGGEGLYVRGRSGQNRYGAGYNHKKSQGFVRNEDQVLVSGDDRYDNADVMMAMSVEELLDWIMDPGSPYYITYMRDYLVDFKEYDGENILLGDGRECRVRGTCKVQVQMRDGSSFVLDNVRKQLGEYQTGWKIKTGNVLDSRNQRSTQQCMKSGVAKHLGVAGIQQQNGLVNETNVTLFAKVRCFLIQSGLSKVFWADDTTMSTYLVNRSPSSAIGFKTPIDMLGIFGWLASIKQGMLEPVKVKCIFLGYRKGIVGNKLWRFDDVTSKVLQGVEFEVEPQDDHTFEVEPHGNVDHVVAWELFSYKEDNNEATFAVAAVENIYAHESLTFNNTVAYEVISKWKAGLKDDMDARSDVYVLSNGCKKYSDDNDDYYWEYTPNKAKGNVLGMEIVKHQSGNTLRVSQSRFYNGKLVQTLLEGHSILSLEGSLSGDCDVEKNGKWSCIYAVESQEYQVICTRLDIASADVGMLDKFDRGLQTDVQVFVDFDYTMGRSITVMGRSITRYWLMIQDVQEAEKL
ncbi:zinc finger, CCHC-type containing protein [Tanacetum coccineum]